MGTHRGHQVAEASILPQEKGFGLQWGRRVTFRPGEGSIGEAGTSGEAGLRVPSEDSCLQQQLLSW